MAPGFVQMANAPSLPSNTPLQVNSRRRTARVFPVRLLNSNFPCTRQSLDTPRDYVHAKHDPTQHNTQDVRMDHRSRRKTPTGPLVSSLLTSCAPFPCQSGMVPGVSCQVLTCHNTRSIVLMLLVLSMLSHIKPSSCLATSCSTDALPDHIMSLRALQCLACGWSL